MLEAASELLAGLRPLGADLNAHIVSIGAAVHDVGKVLHPDEMNASGDRHEVDGRRLLYRHGLAPFARFAVTHAKWREADVGLEDLLVALADVLWKGKRVAELELRVVQHLARASGREFWSTFGIADDVFECVAARADERLERS